MTSDEWIEKFGGLFGELLAEEDLNNLETVQTLLAVKSALEMAIIQTLSDPLYLKLKRRETAKP